MDSRATQQCSVPPYFFVAAIFEATEMAAFGSQRKPGLVDWKNEEHL